MTWTDRHARLEAMLFSSGDPLSLSRLAHGLDEAETETAALCRELMDEYRFSRRGIRLLRLEDSYQLVSAPEYAESIRAILEERKPDRLSRAAMEVLALVAYYQPVTRTYIEQLRGVDSSYTIGLLSDRNLIETCGRLEVPGRPMLYRTTQGFLKAFYLSSLEELPQLPEELSQEKGRE